MNTVFAIAITVVPIDEPLLKIIGGSLVILLAVIVARAFFRPVKPEMLLSYISPEGMLTSTLLDEVRTHHPFFTSEEMEKLLQTLVQDGFIETSRSHHHHKMVGRTNAGTDHLRQIAEED